MNTDYITPCEQLINERFVNEPCTTCRKGITDTGRPCTCCDGTGRHRNLKHKRAEREHVYSEFAAKEADMKR